MRLILLAAALVAAAPATAFQAAPPAPPTAPAPVDPARLALATSVVERIWPLGTFQKMMGAGMGQASDRMMTSMFDMPLGEIVPDAPGDEPMDPAIAKMNMRDVMEQADPHFLERQRLTNAAMMKGMTPVMNRMEPRVRSALAGVYAKRFDEAQLRELYHFSSTSTGRLYATESMMLMADPDMMTAMADFGPEMMREMPAIMKQVQAATAHLPPPSETATSESESLPTS